MGSVILIGVIVDNQFDRFRRVRRQEATRAALKVHPTSADV
jgi:hypothetical protein